jgi:hypothetical protein
MTHRHESLKYKRINEVGREVREIRTRLDASGFGDWIEATFERTIVHGIDIHGRAVVHLGDVEIWKSSELNDYYGVNGMVEELSERAAATRKKFAAVRNGIGVALEVTVEDCWYDFVMKPGIFSNEPDEPAVVGVPRDWKLGEVEKLCGGDGKRTFVVEADGDAECEALFAVLEKAFSAEKVSIARKVVGQFFLAFESVSASEDA